MPDGENESKGHEIKVRVKDNRELKKFFDFLNAAETDEEGYVMVDPNEKKPEVQPTDAVITNEAGEIVATLTEPPTIVYGDIEVPSDEFEV